MAFAYDYIERAPQHTAAKRDFLQTSGGSFSFGVKAAGVPAIWMHGVSGATELNLSLISGLWNRLAVTVMSTGEPVIPNTDISVHRISALRAGGMSVAEIMSDFPGLTRRQIEAAVRQSRETPYHGTPYPRKTVKHFLRRGSFGRLKRELAEVGADA